MNMVIWVELLKSNMPYKIWIKSVLTIVDKYYHNVIT